MKRVVAFCLFVSLCVGLFVACGPTPTLCEDDNQCDSTSICKEGICIPQPSKSADGFVLRSESSNQENETSNEGIQSDGSQSNDAGSSEDGAQGEQKPETIAENGQTNESKDKESGPEKVKPPPPVCNKVLCGSNCVDLQNNPLHCGRCYRQCKRSEQCVRGFCRCPFGTIDCNGRCLSKAKMDTDNGNCGGCGLTCYNSGRSSCQGGKCICSRPNETAVLVKWNSNKQGYACVDLTSNNHCGDYGNRCINSECQSGKCTCKGPDEVLCSINPKQHECARLSDNTNHCGTCGNKCLRTQSCTNGTCQCQSGWSICKVKNITKYPSYYEDICIDLRVDTNHCGRCGVKCGKGQTCVKGQCQCPTGQTLCNGTCVDLTKDRSHCGKCGTQCKGDAQCSQGVCGTCNDVCRDSNYKYICVDKQINSSHCGTCNHSCSTGTTGCKSGTCLCSDTQKTTCIVPKKGGRYGDKEVICVDPQTNTQHCGTCGNACGVGSTCVKGKCVCSVQGTTGCKVRTSSGGYETQCFDLTKDPKHCGTCEKTCGSSTCVKGVCQCPQGQVSCGGKCINPKTDRSNCGACGVRCKGSAQCRNGVCDPCKDVCYSGSYSRCTDTQIDNMNCGYCSAMCNIGTNGCNKGKCSCKDPKQTACLAQTVTGHATHYLYSCFDLQSDNKHCGRCRNACGSGSACVKGKCVCNTPSATQCYQFNQQTHTSYKVCVDTQSNTSHCGACGKSCPSNGSCSKGKCVCPQGKSTTCSGYDRYGKPYSLCVDLNSDNNHCGGCGQNCKVGHTCVNKICRP